MTQTEWIISLDDDLKDHDELFVGNVRDGDMLIRCKDCVHWYKGKNINYCRRFWDDDGEPKLYRCTADDYCSMAERKEE